MTHRLRILHISDLHIGKEGHGVAAWRMGRVLGASWLDNLKTIAAAGNPDIVFGFGAVGEGGAICGSECVFGSGLGNAGRFAGCLVCGAGES